MGIINRIKAKIKNKRCDNFNSLTNITSLPVTIKEPYYSPLIKREAVDGIEELAKEPDID